MCCSMFELESNKTPWFLAMGLERFHNYSLFSPVRISWWLVNLVRFPLGLVSFHTEKNPREPKCSSTRHRRTFTSLIGQMFLGWEHERKHRKQVLKKLHWPNTMYYVALVQIRPRFIPQLVFSNCWIHLSASHYGKLTWLTWVWVDVFKGQDPQLNRDKINLVLLSEWNLLIYHTVCCPLQMRGRYSLVYSLQLHTTLHLYRQTHALLFRQTKCFYSLLTSKSCCCNSVTSSVSYAFTRKFRWFL